MPHEGWLQDQNIVFVILIETSIYRIRFAQNFQLCLSGNGSTYSRIFTSVPYQESGKNYYLRSIEKFGLKVCY